MIFHRATEDAIEPCKHMEEMLNRTADGTAPKWMKAYSLYHAARCSRCGRVLKRLQSMLGGLRKIKLTEEALPEQEALTPDRWEELESRWAEVEK